MLQRRIIALLVCLLALGCSKLADANMEGPPLGRISGTLTLADGANVPDDPIRMTLLWETEESSGTSDELPTAGACGPSRKFLELAPQSIDLDPTFPNAFSLDLTAPPPEEALLPEGAHGDSVGALATIVVYADGDGDGLLDSRTGGAPSPDRVLATSAPELWRTYEGADVSQYEVNYFTEAFTHGEPGEFMLEFPQGYSLQSYTNEENGTYILPIDSPIELRVTGAPYLQDLLCESICNDAEDPYECPASPADLPDPPSDALEFLAGNTGQTGYGWSEGGDDRYSTLFRICGDVFWWSWTTCEGCTCRTDSCYYERADVAEEDWPCAD